VHDWEGRCQRAQPNHSAKAFLRKLVYGGDRMSFLRRRTKYGARKTTLGDRTFDSAGEAFRASQLRLLERAGEISDLQYQVTFRLSAAEITYRADFTYTEYGRMVAEDFKGVETERFRIIKKLWQHYGPCLLRITKRRGTRVLTVQEIMPKNAGIKSPAKAQLA